MLSYVRSSDNVEQIAPNEHGIGDKIIAVMSKGACIVREREEGALRMSHAKAHGLLSGALRISGGLPEERSVLLC